MSIIRRLRGLVRTNQNAAVLVGLGVLVALVYKASARTSFNADDFSFLSYFHFHVASLLAGQGWYEWLVGGIVNYSVLRPVAHLIWLIDFAAFGLAPFGYHVVAVLSHLAASYGAYLLCYILTRNRLSAACTGLLFAVMPVHAEAVSWLAANYSVWSGVSFIFGLSFFALFRERSDWRAYLGSVIFFLAALFSKEIAVTFPLVAFAFDLLFHPHLIRRPQTFAATYLPFLVILALRFLFFGHGYRGLTPPPEEWAYYVDANLARVFDPLAVGNLRWLALGCIVLLWVSVRPRLPFLFGLAWIPLTLPATIFGGVNDNNFYIASFGVTLVLAITLTSLAERKEAFARPIALSALAALIVVYGATAAARNESYAQSSDAANAILHRVKEMHPLLPTNARLIFVGVPDYVPQGAPVFGASLQEALQVTYDDPLLQVLKYSRFPLWRDSLERTYYFEVDHRRVNERTDVPTLLAPKVKCSAVATSLAHWGVTSGWQGWETWNDLDEVALRDGAFNARATGNDPVMASPPIDIPSVDLGDIVVTMRVAGDSAPFIGEVYWLATGQEDFGPGLRGSFQGIADGDLHTYRVDIGNSGMLLLGDRITRLRFDPVAMPADISIESFSVNEYCQR